MTGLNCDWIKLSFIKYVSPLAPSDVFFFNDNKGQAANSLSRTFFPIWFKCKVCCENHSHVIWKLDKEEKPLLPGTIAGRHLHRREVYCSFSGSNRNHPIQHLKTDCLHTYIYKLCRYMIIHILCWTRDTISLAEAIFHQQLARWH